MDASSHIYRSSIFFINSLLEKKREKRWMRGLGHKVKAEGTKRLKISRWFAEWPMTRVLLWLATSPPARIMAAPLPYFATYVPK